MSKLSFDYSKWDRLELSDDEDTHHPNLDKNLNIRVNRITRDRKEDEIDTEKAAAEEAGDATKAAKLENKRPLHVGNLCKVTDERTIINRAEGRSDRRGQGEEFSVDEYVEFKKDNAKLLAEYTEADWDKSRAMLVKDGALLLDDHANNYFLLTALDEEMKGNKERVLKFGRQGQIISQIHQLAKPMNRPPRDLVHRFFDKFQTGEAMGAFQEGVDHFLKQIAARAVVKKKEEEDAAAAEAAELAAQEEAEPVPLIEALYTMTVEERKGPGGLDPVEVFESLPESMQECFKSGDVERLKKLSQEMEPGEFEKHFKRCIDAGLWSSGGGKSE
jgi:cell division cycle protein 37